MTEEQQRIRGYLVAQAAKLTPPAIVEKIQAATAELGAAAMSVPAARWGERPEPKEWSGNEVLAHVLAAQAYFGGGVLAVLDDGPVPPRPTDQGVEGAPLRTADAWLGLLTKERSAFYQRVLSADANGRLGEDVAIELIPLALDHRLDFFVRAQDLVAPSTRTGREEGIADSRLPVDERSVAIEGDYVELAVHA